ncbi:MULTISPECIES: hypothetical protein [Bacteroides]|uniref:hypothetical protein n=1 Tax=Bacteroides TaxID=816 RepID=UPI0023F9457D|nr:hypothetical protein [Bacteroides congonensis]
MKQNNKNEKRKRKLRIAARKRKERLEYREKYRTSSPLNDEWSDYNLKLESDKKKAKIWWLIALLFTFGLFLFFIIYIRSEELGTTLYLLIYILCFVSVSILFCMGASFQSRCYHAIQLGECPISPMGVFPKLVGIRYCDKGKNELFEDVKDDVFTYCSAKKIVITNNSSGLGWIIYMLLSIFILYLMRDFIYNDWRSYEALIAMLIILGLLSATVFLYLYLKKNTFIIDRENKMITIPSIYRFGEEKILPYDQVVVSFCSGVAPPNRHGVLVDDYISLTGKEDLPFGLSVGFRGDVSTKYRFAWFICEYMNVSDLEVMPEIEGFEDIISRIKLDNALRGKSSCNS